jgi:long-subunit acyl-CoA synthetase (AMP-forming)
LSELNFGRVLRRTPLFRNDPAVKDLGNGHEATYGEHLERVGKLCAILASLCVGPSDRIAVLADTYHAYHRAPKRDDSASFEV